jgi:hypothetical protein
LNYFAVCPQCLDSGGEWGLNGSYWIIRHYAPDVWNQLEKQLCETNVFFLYSLWLLATVNILAECESSQPAPNFQSCVTNNWSPWAIQNGMYSQCPPPAFIAPSPFFFSV